MCFQIIILVVETAAEVVEEMRSSRRVKSVDLPAILYSASTKHAILIGVLFSTKAHKMSTSNILIYLKNTRPPKTPPNILFVWILWLTDGSNRSKNWEWGKWRQYSLRRQKLELLNPCIDAVWTFTAQATTALRSPVSNLFNNASHRLKMVIFGILTKVALFGRRFKQRCERRRWRDQEQ